MSVPYETVTYDGKLLGLTGDGWRHICTVHPELEGELDKVSRTTKSPDLVKQGNKRDTFYKFFPETIVSLKYLVLIIKYLNAEGLVVTRYFTGKIRKGEILWKRP